MAFSITWAREVTAPPEIHTEFVENGVFVIATGNGHICLYVEDILYAEGEGEAVYMIEATTSEREYYVSATAQEENKEVSDYAITTIIVPAVLEITEPPLIEVSYDDPESQEVTVVAYGNGHILLYLNDYLVAEGHDIAEWVIPYVDAPEGVEYSVSATAQETGKEVSETVYCTVFVPGKQVEPYQTPAPELFRELTDEALVITAYGEGTVTLYIQHIDNETGEITSETYADESSVTIPVARGEEDMYINYWATAQANEDAIIGYSDVFYGIIVPARDNGPEPFDPHNYGTWLVIYDKNGDEVFYNLNYEDCMWNEEEAIYFYNSECRLVPVDIATFGNYQENGFNVKFYVLIDGKHYGPNEDLDALIYGHEYGGDLESLKNNPLKETDNCFTLKLGEATGTYMFKCDVENDVHVLKAASYYGVHTGLPSSFFVHVTNMNGEIVSFPVGTVDLYNDEFGTGEVPFYIQGRNGLDNWNLGAESDMLKAVIGDPFAHKTVSGSNNFTVPAGYRYQISLINEELTPYGPNGEVSNMYLYVQQLDTLHNPIDNCSFSVDKPTILLGDYQTYRARVSFKEEYASQVNDVKIEIILPYSSQFIENSVMTGNSSCNYSIDYIQDLWYELTKITVPLNDLSQTVRLCATPEGIGFSNSEANVVYNMNGNTYRRSIGSTLFNASDASIYVTPVTGDAEITVYGIATEGKTVKVYDNDALIAQTNCLSNGSWRVTCNLHEPVNPSVHPIHATVMTTGGDEMYTESVEVEYRVSAPHPDSILMHFYDQDNVFDFIKGTVSPGDYVVPNAGIYSSYFTFVANLKGTTDIVHNLRFKILDTKGKITTANGVYVPSRNGWICSVSYADINKLPISVGLEYNYVWNGELCTYNNDFSDNTNGVTPNVLPHVQLVDPSGYVYEAVPSNRLQGVTATCYYKDHESGEPVLWDAEQYEQHNPLLTDENGYYRWDVPIGLWQVKYEKEGYETTYSDWLPVPPPQLDVNVGMVQMRQPEVIKAHAYPQAVELEFDKYMLPETLTTDNVTVIANGRVVEGTIELLNAEVDDPDAITSLRRSKGTGLMLASRIRFNVANPFNVDKLILHVKQDVKSYAGLSMNGDYEVVLPVEIEMQSIVVDSVVVVPFLGTKQLVVAVSPIAATAGKVLNVRAISPVIANADSEAYTLDENGQAVITVHGNLLGMTSLLFSIEGYNLTVVTLVNVEIAEETALRGDVNADGEVNIADVDADIRIILGGQADEETMIRADVNNDKEINIVDIDEIIRIILSPANNVSLNVNSSDVLRLEDLSIKPGEIRSLIVRLDHAYNYNALQCDIVLPLGLTLVDVMPANGHVEVTGSVGDGKSRTMTYSMDRQDFNGDDHGALTLTVCADEALALDSHILLENVVVADAADEAWHLADCTAAVNNTTGLHSVNGDGFRVWVEGRYLCISTQQAGTAHLATIDGIVRALDVKAGLTRQELNPGIYIVVMNGKSHKIVIR